MATLAERERGIKLEDMPKTFRDAVLITRSLGFRYLWIDSLYNIQDSSDDWNREAKEMGRYYRTASLTIFARDSTGDEQGCFKDRDGDSTALCRSPMFDGLVDVVKSETNSISFVQRSLTYRNGYFGKEDLHGFDNIDKFEPVLPSTHKGLTCEGVLNTRGWTLQELVFSTCSLIFIELEVEWLCSRMLACECLPKGILKMYQVD